MASSVSETKTRSWWGTLPLLVTVLTGLLLSWHSLSDLDIWFHLRSGRDLLDGQGVSQVNKYSFTQPDHPWINHEWLFQVLAAVTGPEPASAAADAPDPDVSGWNLLRASLTLLLLLTLLGGDGGKARILGRDGAPAAAWAAVPILAGLLLLWPRLTLRPELFSYVFFVVMVRWTEQFFRFSKGGAPGDPGPSGSLARFWSEILDPRRLGGRLFLLTVLWAQLHGFAAMAPIMILLGAVLVPMQDRWGSHPVPPSPGPACWQKSAGLLGLLILALLMTPNGIDGLMMPVRAVSQFFQDKADLRTTISELVPLQKSPNSLGLTITAYRLSLVWGIVWIVATAGRVSLSADRAVFPGGPGSGDQPAEHRFLRPGFHAASHRCRQCSLAGDAACSLASRSPLPAAGRRVVDLLAGGRNILAGTGR